MIKDGTINLVNQLFVEFHLETIKSKEKIHYDLLKKQYVDFCNLFQVS